MLDRSSPQNSKPLMPSCETDPVIVEAAVECGRAAWARLRSDRKSWTDWLAVGRALAIGRAEAMKAAQTNRPGGATYNRLMGNWLRENGLSDITAQERYRLLLILENLTAIGTWRASLDDAKRRQLNHPNAIWSHWVRSTKPAAPPRRQDVVLDSSAQQIMQRLAVTARAIYWPQNSVRRAFEAMVKSKSSDLLTLARLALEAAIVARTT